MIGNFAVLVFSAALAAPTPCASIKSISLPNTTITMAESVPAGQSMFRTFVASRRH
jgi:hypothetical protein